MLRRALQSCIVRVHVELEHVGQVSRHDRSVVEVDVLAAIHDSRHVVYVLEKGIAVLAGSAVNYVHRRPSSSIVHARALDLEVLVGVAGAKREFPARLFQRIRNSAPREAQSAVISKHRADAGAVVDHRPCGARQANCFKHEADRLVDALDIRVRKHTEPPPLQPWPDRLQFVGKLGTALCNARRTTRATAAADRPSRLH